MDGVLAEVPLFAALDDDATAALTAAMTTRDVDRSHVVFSEGDAGDRLFVVLDGKVKISRTANDGRENLLTVLGPGEMFGELSLFDPGPRTATATAVTQSRLASLDHDDLRPLLLERPGVSVHLLRALAQRLRRTNEAMADLVFSDVPGRVANALLGLAEKFGVDDGEGVRVQHDLTQEELAQLVGASRETVNKALSEFANRGWLRLEGRSVLLLDSERRPRRARGGQPRRSPVSASSAASVGPSSLDISVAPATETACLSANSAAGRSPQAARHCASTRSATTRDRTSSAGTASASLTTRSAATGSPASRSA